MSPPSEHVMSSMAWALVDGRLRDAYALIEMGRYVTVKDKAQIKAYIADGGGVSTLPAWGDTEQETPDDVINDRLKECEKWQRKGIGCAEHNRLRPIDPSDLSPPSPLEEAILSSDYKECYKLIAGGSRLAEDAIQNVRLLTK